MNRAVAARLAWTGLALLFLNATLSFNNWWPTPAIWPDARLAPEFIYTWAALLFWVAVAGALPPRALSLLAFGYCLLIAGRYADVTVPALFGRPINLYWDGQQIPRLLWVSAKGLAWWQSVGCGLALGLLLWGLYRLVRGALAVIAREAVPRALNSRWGLALSVGAVVAALANLGGWRASWPYISRPVIPTFVRQAELLATAFVPGRIDRELPRSPAFDGGVQGLGGADLKLVMLESYGAVAFDNAQARSVLAPAREIGRAHV